jgi:hypothetical protein
MESPFGPQSDPRQRDVRVILTTSVIDLPRFVLLTLDNGPVAM